jgi:DNA-binding CsgD family transcriptional regulator
MAATGFTPLERRMVRLSEEGLGDEEIGRRFRKSPDFVQRVRALARVPRKGTGPDGATLRPVERRVLKWREEGASPSDIAVRFNRQPRSIEQIERLARYKQSGS